MKLPLLKDANISGKTVFLRADLDVPLKVQSSKFKVQSSVGDDTRLVAGLPTIEYLLKHEAKVIIAGHLGRPKPVQSSKFKVQSSDSEFSLEPVANWLVKRFKIYDLRFMNVDRFVGWEITPKLFLLENLRFYQGEEKNNKEFAKKLASIADIYVNDAFAASHRAHASIVGVPRHLPHFAGFRLQKEIEVLSKVLQNPDRPLVVIVGGAKIETKLPLVEKMHHFADYVLVGGKIAQETKELLKVQHEKLKDRKSILLVGDLNQSGTDITQKSVENFLQIIDVAKTIVWNGPVGLISQKSKVKSQKSNEDTERGTRELAKGIVKSKAYSVVGGGDTISFLNKLGILDKFSFVSTGGGAMLEYLSGEKLPGIEALK